MNDICKTAIEIKNKVENDKNVDDYVDFKKLYPKFYAMLLNKDMDEMVFNKLIEIMSSTNTLNETHAADFSTFGAEKYLYPKFGKPTEKQIENAKNKINKLY